MNNLGGRPSVITEEVLQKLEEAFLNGATDRQATFLANISEGTLYNYIKENPEFGERKELLKQMTSYQAKANITESIRKNIKIEDSKWYLERKNKKEFGNNVDLTSDGEALQPILVKFINEEPTNSN
jgi:hypothetical protein